MDTNRFLNIVTAIRYLVAAVGAAITAALGGWDLALRVLVAFVIIDYLTGVIAAWYERRLDSQVGMRGIARKVLLFVPVALAHWLDQLVGGTVLRSLAIWFYIANEGLSVTENLGRAGIPIPAVLMQALVQLKHKGDTGGEPQPAPE